MKPSKVDWATPYDEWLIPILNRYRYGGPLECRAIPSEIQLEIELLVTTRLLLEWQFIEQTMTTRDKRNIDITTRDTFLRRVKDLRSKG
jgi:hypothetical protein